MKYTHIFFSLMLLSLVYMYGLFNIAFVEAIPDTTFQQETIQDRSSGINLTNPVGINPEGTLQEFADSFVSTLGEIAIRVLVALSLLVFLWGLMKYMYKGQESDAARADGRKLMLWGIIALFVMTSVWGLVTILASILGVDLIGPPQFGPSNFWN